MKKQFIIAMGIGLIIGGCLALSSRMFGPESAQAQCVQFYLASGPVAAAANCGAGTRLSVTQSDATRFTALCAQ